MDGIEFGPTYGYGVDSAPTWMESYPDIYSPAEISAQPDYMKWQFNTGSDNTFANDGNTGDWVSGKSDTGSEVSNWLDSGNASVAGDLMSGGYGDQLDVNSNASNILKGETTSDLIKDAVKAGQTEPLENKPIENKPKPPPSTEKNGLLEQLTKTLGEKGVAALVQGGFGMLAGASQGKMLQAKWDQEKKARDEDWARKDKNAFAGTVNKMNWKPSKGLLGTSAP